MVTPEKGVITKELVVVDKERSGFLRFLPSLRGLVWLAFFVVIIIIPYWQQASLERTRQRLIDGLGQARNSRVITLIHREESISLLGFPVVKYIDLEDSEEILRAIRMTDKSVPIDLVLHTPGGLVLAAEQIARALANHPAKVTVFVPHYAMSGGTLIALAANEIVMDENAVLGPVDPQLGQEPAASILRVVEQKDKNEIEDKTLIMADIAAKAINQVKNTIANLLKDNMDEEKSKNIAEVLTSGKWTHDY